MRVSDPQKIVYGTWTAPLHYCQSRKNNAWKMGWKPFRYQSCSKTPIKCTVPNKFIDWSFFLNCHNKIGWWDTEDTRIKINFKKAFAPLFNKVVTSHHISLGTYFCSGSQKKKGRKNLKWTASKTNTLFLSSKIINLTTKSGT